MDITNLIFSQEKRFAKILHQLQKAERRDCQARLPNPASGRVFELARRRAHIVDVKRQFWALENRNPRLGQKQNGVHVASLTIQIFKNVIPSEERTEHVQTRDGHNSVNCEVAVCARIPTRFPHVLELRETTAGSRTDRTGTFSTRGMHFDFCQRKNGRFIFLEFCLLLRAGVSLKLKKCLFFKDILTTWVRYS